MPEQDMRKNVIKGLECCTTQGFGCIENKKCPYSVQRYGSHCVDSMLRDALALLKAQEAVVPIQKQSKHGWFFYCPKCETILNDMAKPKYCSECGQAVKWE